MAAALLVGSGVALAASVDEEEPNNSYPDGAQNIDGSFSLGFDPNIGDRFRNTSEIIPHATINGTGDRTVDWYSFTVSEAGDGVILDVDGAYTESGGVDFLSEMFLTDSTGVLLQEFSNSAPTEWGQGGSAFGSDAYLEYTFQTPGTYYVGIGQTGGFQPIDPGASYQLQVSLGELFFYCDGQRNTIEAQPGRPVKGTQGDDIIAGTQGPDTINGNGGNDTICGRDGANTIKGGDGDDIITSGSSNDSISGGDGNDHMRGGDGNDRIKGDRSEDVLLGEGGNDTLDGGLGPDYINGGEGTDKCSLGEIGRDECELAIGPNVNP
jgi:Ca2+-binding RTX toxin-like protein